MEWLCSALSCKKSGGIKWTFYNWRQAAIPCGPFPTGRLNREKEKMEKFLKAGQLAPTAVNFQPQKIYILKSNAAIDKIRSLTRFAYDAPVVMLF